MVKVMQISAGEFKAKCLQLMDDVARTHEPIIITKHGKPLATLNPYIEPGASPFGFLKGQGQVQGDIVASTEENWDAQ